MCFWFFKKKKNIDTYFDQTKRLKAKPEDFVMGWCNHGEDTFDKSILDNARPNERQKLYLEYDYYNFVHYGMNTFTGKEWGDGKESPSLFNPQSKVDTSQWVRTFKASGSKGVIFTAKHHDGFCMWPSAYTDHTIAASPYQNGKGDIVAQLSKSCKKYDIKLGLYLSPWDMHEPTYGTPAYDDYFVNQLTELLTNYGEIFMVWLDGARDPRIKTPNWNYDFERYYKVINELQPNCIIVNCGPDVRWIGNENGKMRSEEWSVVSASAAKESSDLSSRRLLASRRDAIFYPAEADVSLHKGWFYHENESPKSAADLIKLYYKVVGGNASLLLNVPPSKKGIIEQKDVDVLSAFGQKIIADFSKQKIPKKITVGSATNESEPDHISNIIDEDSLSYMLKRSESIINFYFVNTKIRTIVFREDLVHSQRIEDFDVYAKMNDSYYLISHRKSMGNRTIICFEEPVETNEIKLVIRSSRARPYLRFAGFYS